MSAGNGNGLPDYNAAKALAQAQGQAQLPATREAVVEQGLRIQQETAAERDALRRALEQRDSDIAGYKVAIEAQATQLAEADSRVATMTLVRDEAVARRAEVETVLGAMLALGRAFQIASKPLVRTVEPPEDDR